MAGEKSLNIPLIIHEKNQKPNSPPNWCKVTPLRLPPDLKGAQGLAGFGLVNVKWLNLEQNVEANRQTDNCTDNIIAHQTADRPHHLRVK